MITKIKQLQEAVPDVTMKWNDPLSRHTSLRIGGPALAMVFPETVEQLYKVWKMGRLLDIPMYILGAGTNILAPDEGIQGLVICLKDSLSGMEQTDTERIVVMAGVTMTRMAMFAANHGLGGLEFAHGIPGTVGGGVYMNAGAYGGEIASVCEWAEVMLPDGSISRLSRNELMFGYRDSILKRNSGIVLRAGFLLRADEPEIIRERMHQLQAKRLASQPLDMPSAGSAFKRPAGGYAAALIDEAGLRGYQVGQAAISRKHCGFAVNLGGATAADMRSLLQNVQRVVKDHSGIQLEPEILIW